MTKSFLYLQTSNLKKALGKGLERKKASEKDKKVIFLIIMFLSQLLIPYLELILLKKEKINI